jgi:hypothetical protein
VATPEVTKTVAYNRKPITLSALLNARARNCTEEVAVETEAALLNDWDAGMRFGEGQDRRGQWNGRRGRARKRDYRGRERQRRKRSANESGDGRANSEKAECQKSAKLSVIVAPGRI